MRNRATIVSALLVGLGVTLGIAVWTHRGDSAGLAPPRVQPARAARSDSLMLARRAGDLVVGLAIDGGGSTEVTAVGPDLAPIQAAGITLRAADGPWLAGTACGRHCVRFASGLLQGRAAAVTVRVTRADRATIRTSMAVPGRMPPSASGTLAAANKAMLGLSSARIDEVLSSGSASVRTRWLLDAPDRLSYTSSNGARGIVVGSRRWDWYDGRWHVETAELQTVPSYMWSGAGGARLLGPGTVGGLPVRVVAAFRPAREFPAWFRLYVTRTGRVVRMEMTAPAHFMVQRFSAFDRQVRIRPPVIP